MSAISDPLAGKKRLDSWKEIASFFGRDERTVKRWEKERALPVYRVPGSARGGVFAYADELTRWLEGSENGHDSSNGISQIASAGSSSHKLVQMASPLVGVPRLAVQQPPSESAVTPKSKSFSVANTKTLLWLASGTAAVLAIVFFVGSHRSILFKTAMAAPHRPIAEAQDLYLDGRYHWNKRTPDDLNQAVDLFTQAIVRDPSYAQAYVGLADCYNLLREFSVMPPGEAYPRALAAAQKAVELDPNSADAHTSLAFALFWGKMDVAGGEREFQRAIALDPNNTRAHHWYGTFLNEIGQRQRGLEELSRAQQLDPSSPAVLADKALLLYAVGRADEGVALLKQIETSDPAFLSAHNYLSWIYFDRHDAHNYFREAEIASRIQHNTEAQSDLANQEKAFASKGFQGVLEYKLREDQKLLAHDRGSEYAVAIDFALLDDSSDALKHLAAAVDRHEYAVTSMTTNFSLNSLHGSPIFDQLVAKVGLPPATPATNPVH